MKIAFVGSHSCGKTTAAAYTVSFLKQQGINNVMLVPEVARRCPYPVGEKGTFKAQAWILLKQIQQEVELEDKADIIILDRSVLDVAVYSDYLYFHTGQLSSLEFNWIVGTAKEWMKAKPYYALIVFEPLDLIPDWARGTNKKFQEKIDKLFKEYLAEPITRCPVFTIEEKSRRKRSQIAANTVLQLVKNIKR